MTKNYKMQAVTNTVKSIMKSHKINEVDFVIYNPKDTSDGVIVKIKNTYLSTHISSRIDNIKDIISLETMIKSWKKTPEYQSSKSCQDELKYKINCLKL